jgi:hypothetical protein
LAVGKRWFYSQAEQLATLTVVPAHFTKGATRPGRADQKPPETLRSVGRTLRGQLRAGQLPRLRAIAAR